jgi:D-glycero-D-manno-heptose 1,7-bisphosphate phosphatase
MKRKAIFIDRDGTIMYDKHFLRDPEDVELLPGAAEAIQILNRENFDVIVISNQSGVARGYFTENEVKAVNDRLIQLLHSQNARIDAIYYCPYYDKGIVPEYSINHPCRKPNPGMIKQAVADMDVEPVAIIGDRAADIQLAKKVGVPGILVLSGLGAKQDEITQKNADFIAPTILEAARWLIENIKK